MEKYIASYLVIKDGKTIHGLRTCDASSHAEAYGIMKRGISSIYKGYTIHISNIITIYSILDETFDIKEFESQ